MSQRLQKRLKLSSVVLNFEFIFEYALWYIRMDRSICSFWLAYYVSLLSSSGYKWYHLRHWWKLISLDMSWFNSMKILFIFGGIVFGFKNTCQVRVNKYRVFLDKKIVKINVNKYLHITFISVGTWNFCPQKPLSVTVSWIWLRESSAAMAEVSLPHGRHLQSALVFFLAEPSSVLSALDASWHYLRNLREKKDACSHPHPQILI